MLRRVSRSTSGKRQQLDSPDARAAQLAADEWGVLDIDELRACGLLEPGGIAETEARATPPPSPGCLRLGPRGRDVEGPVARGGQGVRPRRRAEPPGRGRALEPAALGRRLAARRDRAGHGTRRTMPRRERAPHPQPTEGHPLRPHPRHDPRPDARRPLLSAAVQTASQSGPPSHGAQTSDGHRTARSEKQHSYGRSSPTATSPPEANSRTPSSTSSPTAASPPPT